MATDDSQVLVTGTAAAPASFTIPGNGQIRPKTIFANYDGTGASGDFLPALKIVSDGGEIVGIYPTCQPMAAGVSAGVGWFPWLDDCCCANGASGGAVTDITSTGGTLAVSNPAGPKTNLDLTTTGVTAATYGDATHVGQVAVDANGRVTSASNVAITGSGVTAVSSSGGTITVTNPNGPTANVDLPTTGVTAATYGDATHVAQVAVDAEGRLTAASSVAIAGLSGSGLVRLFDSILAAPAASIDTGAGGIASGHESLYIIVYARCVGAVVQDALDIRFNNDSGNNYDYMWMRNNAGVLASASGFGSNAIQISATPGGSVADANVYGVCRMSVPSYDRGTAYKSVEATGGFVSTSNAAFQQINSTAEWRSTAAISRLAVFANGGSNLQTGSRLTIYGTQ